MAKKQVVESEQDKQYREVVEKIAGNISGLARAVAAMLNGPINRRALVILLANSSGNSQRSVDEILKALENLEKDWLNKK